MLASETLFNLAKQTGLVTDGAAGVTGHLRDKTVRDRIRAAMLRAAIVEELIVAGRAGAREQAAIIKTLATGENIELGANNFYDLGDILEYQIDVRVELQR